MEYIKLNNQILQLKNNFYDLEADQKAIKNYLNTEINPKLKRFNSEIERIKYLIDNNYYVDFIAIYGEEKIQKFITKLKEKEFNFYSFMAISKFYSDYALKTNDKKYYLETFIDRIIACSLFFAKGDMKQAFEFANAMKNQWIQLATPTFLNAGLKNAGKLISCFLLQIEDSLNSINYTLSTAMQLSKIGGGVSINLSNLRARNSYVRNRVGVAKGIMPVMKLFEDAFKYVDQLGQRKGAGAVYLNIFHQDVVEFLDCKKINADENLRIQTLSTGLIIPTKFFELTRDNLDFYTFDPKNVFDVTGKYLDDINLDKEYENLVNNDQINKKKMNARKMLIQIAQSQFESGYPYIMYKTNANNQNPLKNLGNIKMSNLCTEIFQIQSPSIITSYGEPDIIGEDISCNLGSINIENVMKDNSLEQSINTLMEMMNIVSDDCYIDNAPGINNGSSKYHSIGIGAMNLAGYLAKNQILYSSEQAREFADIFFMSLNYYSIKKSCEVAQKWNETFFGFEKSEYANGQYFEKYINHNYEPSNEKIKSLFKNFNIPTQKMWVKLADKVAKYGLYNAFRLAIAPTQSISYIQNATASISPITELIEERMYKNSKTYYPMPFLSPNTRKYYEQAWFMDQRAIIDMVSVIQQHVDQGISTVLYVTSNTSVGEVIKLYNYALTKNLKSLYYVRTKNFTIDECISCAV